MAMLVYAYLKPQIKILRDPQASPAVNTRYSWLERGPPHFWGNARFPGKSECISSFTTKIATEVLSISRALARMGAAENVCIYNTQESRVSPFVCAAVALATLVLEDFHGDHCSAEHGGFSVDAVSVRNRPIVLDCP